MESIGLLGSETPGIGDSRNRRRQDAKTRKEQLPSFLCAFNNFAPSREMLFLFVQLFHSFWDEGTVLEMAVSPAVAAVS